MLDNTFIHLPNYGPHRERKLWRIGIRTWDDFLQRFGSSPFLKAACATVASSRYALDLGDADYFGALLPSDETWRAFPHFKKVAYLDIETTGLGPQTDYVTVIGVYDGRDVRSYVHGKNLHEFAQDIRDFDLVVTFNGSMFDIPFLRKAIRGLYTPPLHVDLRFVLASLGVRGGLKRIEQQFGLEREDDLQGLTGYDAVKLWRRYDRYRDNDALDKLVRYNSADIASLKTLAEWAYKGKRKQTGFDEIY